MHNRLGSTLTGSQVNLGGLAAAVGLGSGLMYLLDPESGRRRRALAREKVVHLAHVAGRTARKARTDVKNRSKGLKYAVRSLATRDREVADEVLVERVRARLGAIVSHSRAINVSALNGVVTLAGPILDTEARHLMRAARHVRGVRGAIDHLERHALAEGIPALQGEGHRRRRPELLQEDWAPAVRLLTFAAGGALIAGGIPAGGLGRVILAGAGSALLVRALTNLPIKRLVGLGAGRRAIDVEKAIWVAAPADQVFAFLRDFRNLPRFMSHLESVTETDGNRSHWVARGPAGIPVSWDVELTRIEANRLIAWRSTLSSTVRSAGVLRLEPDARGRTLTSVRLSYNPPAGAVGHAISRLFGADPKKALDDDLLRLKSLFEQGRATAHGRTATREELAPRAHSPAAVAHAIDPSPPPSQGSPPDTTPSDDAQQILRGMKD